MPQTYIVPPCREAVSIIYQDDDLLLVNKPTGLLSVPGRHPDNSDSLISRLQTEYKSARIVHRLDMDTSGIMVVALNAEVHRALNKLFEQRQVEKSYTAVVSGSLKKVQGTVDLPLICDWPNRPLQKVDFEQGKPALTHYELLAGNKKSYTSRVRLKPVTGRSHQLRVHMAELGHPILGCKFYAPEGVRRASNRLLLHAETLKFEHPVTGEMLDGTSHVPF